MAGKAVIGFAGLGLLGEPMARALVAAEYELRVYNRTPEKADRLVEMGAARAATPAEIAVPGGIVVTVVANDQALHEVTHGESGFLGRLGEGGLHISCSTISPATARELSALHAERGERYLAAPVFGRGDAALAGMLRICVSGRPEARERARPVLDALGQAVFDFGDDPGAANVVKLCGNFMIAAAVESMAEAFTMAEKNGIPRQAVHEMFSQTLFASPIYQNYGRMVAAHEYEPPGFHLPLGLKDVLLFQQTGLESGVPTPLAGLVRDRLVASVAKGREKLDWTAFALEASEDAGL